MSKLSGAEIFIESLKREQVEVIFGYPGGKNIPIYNLLYDEPIKHILVRHEQAAAHAADGYARSTGKVGVCLATSGPGATNLVTGLATAYMDSVPVVAFTGQVDTKSIGKDAFQEADIRGITMPITKHNYLVTDIKDLARTIKEAFYIARTGRPGPVLIDMPVDVLADRLEFEYPEEVDLPGYRPNLPFNGQGLDKAAAEINKAERPVIFAGGGVISSGAAEVLRDLARKAKIPVTTSLMGLGAYPIDDELSLGMPGMHGSKYANYALCEADLLIGVGVRFDDRVTGRLDAFAPKAKIIHVDIDKAEINKNVDTFISLTGDARDVLSQLLPLVEEIERKEWLAQIAEWKREYPLTYKDDDPAIKPQAVVEELNNLSEGKAIIVTEVGQHQMWAAQYYNYSYPRNFITSGGLGTMGFGLPAAVGAQVGRPGELVVDISGDGSFQMNLQELATISEYNLPVKIVIINNGTLGMVRQWQELLHEKRYSSTILKNPDFVKLAAAFDIKAIRIEEKDELRAKLKEAIDYDGPVLIDVRVAWEENVWPMVPPGAGNHEMIGGE
ncbi:MAG TPA: biosynthetic-type acetolactate synthase large subunit [Halanaerobiaceae bacterium]|nr:biosynthetic-type acetolactate synthase large subunit [Bacillota bacterium]HHU93378.1 biosynthetic-type acetolactate synthase large subunit [Halanaerobiaceae bacterium]HOA40863.1 biosynthetic-type acetolactate synthase large subunit [Halanaerobiales bacterium]HPZ62801.1 biosynthetic-type acetolactate synthase large subunit [Halanaerobiales bacterium]HQD04784.1 biosynthetic-type acetolactate synthase large subunit [Halanaerobiales bacterium]